MRPIDADALLKYKCNCYDEDGHLLYAVPTGYIVNAPAIDAVPVVHGKWYHRERWGLYVCSVCSFEAEDNTKYCPRCGAKMYGEVTDGT